MMVAAAGLHMRRSVRSRPALDSYTEYQTIAAVACRLEQFFERESSTQTKSNNSSVYSTHQDDPLDATKELMLHLQRRLLQIECEIDPIKQRVALKRLFMWYSENAPKIPAHMCQKHDESTKIHGFQCGPKKNNELFAIKCLGGIVLDQFTDNAPATCDTVINVKKPTKKAALWTDTAVTQPVQFNTHRPFSASGSRSKSSALRPHRERCQSAPSMPTRRETRATDGAESGSVMQPLTSNHSRPTSARAQIKAWVQQQPVLPLSPKVWEPPLEPIRLSARVRFRRPVPQGERLSCRPTSAGSSPSVQSRFGDPDWKQGSNVGTTTKSIRR